MTHAKNGQDHHPAIVEIVRIRRISQSQPTAWEGFTSAQTKVHIAYRYGVVSISFWRCSRQHGANWGSWEEVLRFNPIELMAITQLWKEGNGRSHSTNSAVSARIQRLRLECQNRVLGEIRADVWPRRDKPTRIVHVRELWEWLETREKFFEPLHRAALAGGLVRIRLSALTDGAA